MDNMNLGAGLGGIYLDNNATTQIDPQVVEAMQPYLSVYFGNASSQHGYGVPVEKAIAKAREQVADFLGAEYPDEIIFTSCATESDNTALWSALWSQKGKTEIVTTPVEHPAIMQTCDFLSSHGATIKYLKVSNHGDLDLKEFENLLTPNTALASVMWANNETGNIYPVPELAEIAYKHGVMFHTDAVQAVGNMKINVKEMNIDLMSVSGHKIHAPKGVGCLYCRKGIELPKLIHGGHQERNKRAGTDNVAFIAAFGQAIEEAVLGIEKNSPYIKSLRDRLYDKISDIPDMNVNGSMENRLPGNLNLSFGGIEGESLILSLDMHGICVSSGAACASGSLEASHVLRAIGLDDERARGSVRITLNEENSFDDVDYIAFKLRETVERLRKLNPNWNFR